MPSTTADFDFVLLDTENVPHRPHGDVATVVIFVSNRSPDWLAWQERVVAIAADYQEKGVSFIAINTPISFPTRVSGLRFPTDDLDGMRSVLRARDWGPIAYVLDPGQATARRYGAVVAPDVFVLDGSLNLCYRGSIGEHYEEKSDDGIWLRAALDALLDGRKPTNPGGHSVGVPIKWLPLAP